MDKDSSSYSAMFAIIILTFILIFIAYNTFTSIYADSVAVKEERLNKRIVFENIPADEQLTTLSEGDEILYKGLTDKEADRIINELLKSGETNQRRVGEIESNILE